jgi:integral membrane protein
MAWVTGVVLAIGFTWMVVLIIFWMSDGESFTSFFSSNEEKPSLYSFLWLAHGWLYFLYLIAAVNLAFLLRFPIVKTVALLLAGTIPFASFYADYVMHRYVRNRYPDGDEEIDQVDPASQHTN